MQVEELSAVRQTLQADLETSIRRIADLQAALEEVESSDESDTERYDSSSLCKYCHGNSAELYYDCETDFFRHYKPV